jgi:hypothetical protein
MRTDRRLWAVAGPGAFALASVVGSRLERGYRTRDEPISALAAHGTRSAPVMVGGFLGLAVGSFGLSRALRGSTSAPAPVPTMLALAGLTTAGAGLARCSDRTCPTRMLGDAGVQPTDDLHAAFSAATFALWIATPLVAAARARHAGKRFRRTSTALGVTTLVTLVAGGARARDPEATRGGVDQRVMVASALAWFPLVAFSAR